MIKKVNIEDVIDEESIIFIDVRSPKEYNEDTIPGAYNIPIFSDEEREEIGYVYKQVSKNDAKLLGLKYASTKLVDIYSKVLELISGDKKVALFCYRGGMRSNSIANVLSTMGISVYLINGGYKSYRSYVSNNLNSIGNDKTYIVLHGYTGVGKTKILDLLKDRNEPIINLEYLASNTGSAFGNLPFKKVSSNQKTFESLLFRELKNIDKSYIFIESESKRIGNAILSETIFDNMQKGKHILLKTSLDNRINNIFDDYVKNNNKINEKVIQALKNLNKKLGNVKTSELINMINNNNYKDVIKDLMINYYDPLYEYSIKKVEKYDKIIEYVDINDAVDNLTQYVSSINKKGD